MAMIVFLRGINVGGHRSFRPATFASEMTDLDVVNVGAAGTFIVGKSVKRPVLRKEFLRRLPFETELMVCSGRDIMYLVSSDPFRREATDAKVVRYVTVIEKRPRRVPSLPLEYPAGDTWQVKIVGFHRKFILSMMRRTGKGLVYPNEVVEKEMAVPATTRNWNTIKKIYDILTA